MKKYWFCALVPLFVLVVSCGGTEKGKLEKPLKTVEKDLPIIPSPASTTVFDKNLVIGKEILIVARTTEEKELVNLTGKLFSDLGIQTDITGESEAGALQVLLKIGYNAEILGEEG